MNESGGEFFSTAYNTLKTLQKFANSTRCCSEGRVVPGAHEPQTASFFVFVVRSPGRIEN